MDATRRWTVTRSDRPAASPARLGLALGCCLFAAQASVVVLSPVLSGVAADFGVSTATAGQLRSLSGAVALLIVATSRESSLARS